MREPFNAIPQGERPAGLPEGIDARFRGPLMSFFRRRVNNPSEAEDLTQEVFLRLVRRMEVQGIVNIETYVFQTAANLLRDRVRRRVSHRAGDHFSLDADTEHGGIRPMHRDLLEDREPERVLLGEEALQAVLLALDELGERTRDIFILHRVDKLKHREIAEVYGISVSMVEKHVMQAAAHLLRRFRKP